MSQTHSESSEDSTNIGISSGISASSSLSVTDAAIAPLSLKRPSSPSEDEERHSRKRKRDGMDGSSSTELDRNDSGVIDGNVLANDLAQELQCGCCAGLVYKPVIVVPCDHFFCGSCCTLWVQNGGTNCPACRSVSTAVVPSRMLQSMVDVLLRSAPHLQRSKRERMQADEIYPTLRSFRIPTPREPSPEPVIPTNTDFLQPCPHCSPNNPFHWVCAQPIADPAADPEHAWRTGAGTPPGHGFCGNCEVLLALRAPSTSRCDFCQVSFCGISVQGRCTVLPITAQSPHGMADVIDLIQSPEIYDCFDGNSAEVDVMIDYMRTQRLTPKQIYRQIAGYIQSQPNGFRQLIEQELFVDIHSVPGGTDPDPTAPRRSICRLCAAEVFLYGLREWWIRERRKAICEGVLEARKDCPDGATCGLIGDPAHAKEFNHLITQDEIEDEPRDRSSELHALRPDPIAAAGLTASSAISSLFLPPISSDIPGFSSSSLPSISNLVSDMSLPRFYPPADIFFAPDPTSHGRASGGVSRSVQMSSMEVSAESSQFGSRHQRMEANVESDPADADLQEPSSSQSRRSVETHLMENLADYDSDSSCEIENRVQSSENSVRNAGRELGYSDSIREAVSNHYPFSRRGSPFKRPSEFDASMTDVTASMSPSFASFHGLGTDPMETNLPHSSGVYPVQVE